MEQQVLASEMIKLGARPQVILQTFDLPYGRMVRLYREITGKPLPRGALPFSTEWFLGWRPNIHSTLFHCIYRRLEEALTLEPPKHLIEAYRLYLDWQQVPGEQALLSLTRAWTLLRYLEAELLQLTRCTECGHHFIADANTPRQNYVCGLCAPPARLGHHR